MISSLLLLVFGLLFPLVACRPGTPVLKPRASSVDVLTSYTGFAGCDKKTAHGRVYADILKQAAKDAVTIADAGLDEIRDELLPAGYPQKYHQQVDFSKQAAIEFFGPEKQNYYEQARVFDAMFNAARAYTGWGLDDWWNDRYVFLSCINEHNDEMCANGKATAYYTPDKKYGYPLVIFCSAFFDKLPTHDEAIKKVDADPARKQNSFSMRSQATTFMHELLHINWGTAKECRGLNNGDACNDHWQNFGNKLSKMYRPGAAKYLARSNVTLAATNNDNYAFYAVSKFMQKRWKQYPKYPSAWDPSLTWDQNYANAEKEPGFPDEWKKSSGKEVFEFDEPKELQTAAPPDVKNYPVFKDDQYPDWYKPVFNAKSGQLPDAKEPTDNSLTYNGPKDGKDIVCEVSDGSPVFNDCVHAFGSLNMVPSLGVLHGKKGGTWWAGVSIHPRYCTLMEVHANATRSTSILALCPSTIRTTGPTSARCRSKM